MTIKCDAAFDARQTSEAAAGRWPNPSPQFESSVERPGGHATNDQRRAQASAATTRLTPRGLRPAVPPIRAPTPACSTDTMAGEQDRHPPRRPQAGGLRRHLQAWTGALLDLAAEQQGECVSGCSGPSNPGYSRSLAHRVDGPNTLVRVTRGADRFRLIAASWLLGSGRDHPRLSLDFSCKRSMCGEGGRTY
jgi:hypothetical protein